MVGKELQSVASFMACLVWKHPTVSFFEGEAMLRLAEVCSSRPAMESCLRAAGLGKWTLWSNVNEHHISHVIVIGTLM